MEKKTGKKLLIGSVIGYFVCGASALLLPWAIGSDNQLTIAGFITGILFWAGFIVGTVLFLASWLKTRQEQAYKKSKNNGRPGCISFFKSVPAAVADVVFAAALILTIAGNFVTAFPYMVNVIVIFLLIFTLSLHCILNGRVYRYLFQS